MNKNPWTIGQSLLKTITIFDMIQKVFFTIGFGFTLWVFYLVAKFINERSRHMKLMKVRDQIENIYLVQCDVDGNRPDVGEMEEFVTFVGHDKMEETVKEWMDMLEESGNRLWRNPEVRQMAWIKIQKYFFKDGENVNEDFDEYGERVEWDIRADRASRHGTLKEHNRGWYEFAHHKQNVVEWKNPE